MSYETDNPFAVVDRECSPPYAVTRYDTREKAETYLAYLKEHGGRVLREKAERGGYAVEGEKS